MSGVWVRGPGGGGAERAPAHGAAMLRGWVREDRSPPPAEGVRGYDPRKNFRILHAKS
jgi:hypothetical protein